MVPILPRDQSPEIGTREQAAIGILYLVPNALEHLYKATGEGEVVTK